MNTPPIKKLCGLYALLFALGLGWACAAPQAPAAVARKSLSFLDINVWSGLTYTGTFWMNEYESSATRERRYQVLVGQIAALSPDVIGLHEANPLPEYAKRLAHDLAARGQSYDVYWHVGISGVHIGALAAPVNFREGEALLVKKDLHMTPIGRQQLTGAPVGNDISFNLDYATQILGVKLRSWRRPLYVFLTHWNSFMPNTEALRSRAAQDRPRFQLSSDELQNILKQIADDAKIREGEAKQTLEFIDKHAGNQLFVLMGDLNADPNAPELGALRTGGMLDTFDAFHKGTQPGYTWDPRNNLNQQRFYSRTRDLNQATSSADLHAYLEALFSTHLPRRIDYVLAGPRSAFTNGECRILKSQIALHQPVDGVHASDHFGVFTELECR